MLTLIPKEIIITISNNKTGEVYETEEALKAANIPEEDVQRDVKLSCQLLICLQKQSKTIR
jgi:hypothetical protein